MDDHRRRALDAYRANPLLVGEHAGQEDSFRTGGYADRQVLELVQNAADALARSGGRGRVEIHLVDGVLYCANEGAAFSEKGLVAVCQAYMSDKDGDDIGRFGLGFKSVLGVTDSPAVFSRSVSFAFDARESKALLESIAPGLPAYPVLRLPEHRDPEAEFSSDPVLAELSQWATTVVRLPVGRAAERLERDLVGFPSGFLLFAPHVSTLVLGGGSQSSIELRCEELGEHRYRVTDAIGQDRDWLVWHQTHRPSEAALAEVSRAIGRDEVTVSYAAPLDDLQETGRFWAYFPLTDETSVRGILNAPWNVSDDRTYLHEGTFNEELLDVAAELVVSALPSLVSPTDPARHLDYLPARGRESENFADRRMTVTVPDLAANLQCIPDGAGRLRRPAELTYLDLDAKVEFDAMAAWSHGPGRPLGYPHPSCYRSRVRRARLRRLVRGESDSPTSNEVPVRHWLEALVPNHLDEECASALVVFQSIDDDPTRVQARTAAVLPDSQGGMWGIGETSHLFLRGNPLSDAAGIRVVRTSFLDLPGVEATLRRLGFDDIDTASELRNLATSAANRWSGREWTAFWNLVPEVTLHEANEILLSHVLKGATLKVRCRDGSWQHVGTVVVAGLVRPTNGSLIVDDEFHEDHLEVLRSVGVGDRPRVSRVVVEDMTLLEYRRREREEYLHSLPPRGRPDASALVFRETEGPAPLHVLRRFSDSGDDQSRVSWSEALLAFDLPESWELGPMRGKQHPVKKVLAPHLWAVEHYGLIDTAWGPREARRAVHPAGAALAPLLPIATSPGADKLPGLLDPERLPIMLWREFLDRVPSGGDAAALGALVHRAMGALPNGELPERVPAVRGTGFSSVEPAELFVAVDDQEDRALRERGLPFVVADESAAADLVAAWECRLASDALQVEIVPENADGPVPVLDRYRRLRDYAGGALDSIDLVTCSGLTRVVTSAAGAESESIDFAVAGKSIYATAFLDERELMERIVHEFELDLDDRAVTRVLEEAGTERVRQAIAECRATADPADKLLTILPVSSLAAVVPAGLLDIASAAEGGAYPRQVAELVLHVHGHATLFMLRHELESRGFDVPGQWSGSGPAIAFVRALGFPTEYAGERGASREPEITVLGPPRLNPLHDFQERLADEIRALARQSEQPQRALLFLPTGAGKTRVTVEALVRSINDHELDGPVLWIAQSDELCEQAIQTWVTVWREFGDGPLRLGRLWDRNEVGATETTASVVVATDAKLDVVRGRDEYEWLRRAGVVVLDEAHGATATGITATLRWLGIHQSGTARPFLGLTATPFKGTGEEANRRLAVRFGERVLNVLGDDPYAELQRLGVLARIEHRVLEGSSYALEAAEKAKFDKFKDIPSSVLDRIGADRERTIRLVDDITALPSDWPVLVFTSSVLGAQTLSVLLRMRGITSSAVSGTTPTSERRRTIDEFRTGKIQVLTNCNVLTQGFDAPEVRALYIARPTFSPNAYIQMVGRGLRGPENGGKRECLIVNVADTFDVFGEQLAYHEFDYLWRYQGSGAR
ncbi:helicase-related protein [Isoptericola sp. b490]|uniref:DEAD/DEAH box helicase n=1 Tax=Actinotalea lenta TaxID=3064654 RepID=UPI0027135C23|nr:helicase-related protein [Isoptericola sp. b490]MDO8119715.1 helicase-related protein [Isoptericola sp. b490]